MAAQAIAIREVAAERPRLEHPHIVHETVQASRQRVEATSEYLTGGLDRERHHPEERHKEAGGEHAEHGQAHRLEQWRARVHR
jgi:hypothetical protein